MKFMRTALVRIDKNIHKVFREDDWGSQKEFAENLRGNGFKVLKVWNGNMSDAEIDEWQYFNRNR